MQKTYEFTVTPGAWTPVTDGEADVTVAAGDPKPFHVHVGPTLPDLDAPAVVCGFGRPAAFTGLDLGTRVWVRAGASATKIVVIK